MQLLAIDGLVVVNDDRLGRDMANLAIRFGREHLARVTSGGLLHAGPDQRRFGPHQRHGLALHVGAHQGAVGVVMLEEGNQRGCDRDDLARRNVHVLDLFAPELLEAPAQAALDAVVEEVAAGIEPGVGLRDHGVGLIVGGELNHVVGDVWQNPHRRVVSRVDSLGQLRRDLVAFLPDQSVAPIRSHALDRFSQGAADQLGMVGRQL